MIKKTDPLKSFWAGSKNRQVTSIKIQSFTPDVGILFPRPEIVFNTVMLRNCNSHPSSSCKQVFFKLSFLSNVPSCPLALHISEPALGGYTLKESKQKEAYRCGASSQTCGCWVGGGSWLYCQELEGGDYLIQQLLCNFCAVANSALSVG